jgi:hypothetical protein
MSWSEGTSLFILWGTGGFWSCVWCREWIVHCSISTCTVDYPCKPFFLVLGGGLRGQSKEFPNFWHVPQRLPNSTSFLFHMFWQILSSFHLYSWAKGPRVWTTYLLISGASTVSVFLVMGQSNWLIAKQQNWTWEVPCLMNRIGE